MLGKFSSGGGEWSIEVDSRGGEGGGIKKFPSLDAFNRWNISQECYRYAVWGTGLN